MSRQLPSITRERWRHRLPHWEVHDRPHFVTIRCAGSLPAETTVRLREVHIALSAIDPASPQFAVLQRQYFHTCEKFLDRGEGFTPLRTASVAELVLSACRDLEPRVGWRVTHAVAMPNHIHFLLEPASTHPSPLRQALREFKGRTARQANVALNRSGAFWQADWFDRWIRTDAEHDRIVTYIQQNPVKAGLVQTWTDWPHMISPK